MHRRLPMPNRPSRNGQTDGAEPFGGSLFRADPDKFSRVELERNAPVEIGKSTKETFAVTVPLR